MKRRLRKMWRKEIGDLVILDTRKWLRYSITFLSWSSPASVPATLLKS